MSFILGVLAHTPPWVFVLLAVLVALGLQALRPRTVAVWRLLIVPAVFISWGAISLAARISAAPALIVDWALAAASGFALGWAATRLAGVQVDRAAGNVRMPGSAVPLVRNLTIFMAKYGLAVASAVAPARAAGLAHWDIGVSGLSAGYFIGWLVRFALCYRGEPLPAPASHRSAE